MSKRRAGQDSKSRSSSPRESDPDRHVRDCNDLPPLQSIRKYRSGDQLPRLGTLELSTHSALISLPQEQRQVAESSGRASGQSERNQHETIRQEAQVQQHQSAYENYEAAERYLSEHAALPTHERAGYGGQIVPPSDSPDTKPCIPRGHLTAKISDADQKTVLEMKRKDSRMPYEGIAMAIDRRHDARELQKFVEQQKGRKHRTKKQQGKE